MSITVLLPDFLIYKKLKKKKKTNNNLIDYENVIINNYLKRYLFVLENPLKYNICLR